LRYITLPYSITLLDDRIFDGCSSLVSITILGSIQSIGSFTFSNCKSLSIIRYYGTTNPTFSSKPFNDCSNLNCIEVTDSYKYDDFCSLPLYKLPKDNNKNNRTCHHKNHKRTDIIISLIISLTNHS